MAIHTEDVAGIEHIGAATPATCCARSCGVTHRFYQQRQICSLALRVPGFATSRAVNQSLTWHKEELDFVVTASRRGIHG